MSNLVAFLDMLGNQESIRSGRFHPADTLEFANPVGIAAMRNPEMQFAVFSDSVVVSAPADAVDRFVAVVAHLLGNWFCESILARGGVALGEIEWIAQSSIDGHFRALTNFHYARVYGRALVEAVELERSSGPRAICFLSPSAAEHVAAAPRGIGAREPRSKASLRRCRLQARVTALLLAPQWRCHSVTVARPSGSRNCRSR